MSKDKFDNMIGDELAKFGFGEKKKAKGVTPKKLDLFGKEADRTWQDDYWELKRKSMQGTLSRGTKYEPRKKVTLPKDQFVAMSDECYDAVMNILIEYGIEPIGKNTQAGFTHKMREFLSMHTKVYTEDEMYESVKIG